MATARAGIRQCRPGPGSARYYRAGSRSSHPSSARDFPSGRILAGRTGYSEYPKYYSSPNTKHADSWHGVHIEPSHDKRMYFEWLVAKCCSFTLWTWVRFPRGHFCYFLEKSFWRPADAPQLRQRNKSHHSGPLLTPPCASWGLRGGRTASAVVAGLKFVLGARTRLPKDRPSRALAITCARL